MECAELLKKVRLVINEAASDDNVSLLSVDTRQLDESIMELLPRAVSFIQKNKGAANGRVNTKSVPSGDIEVNADESGTGLLLLPDDFVQIVSLELAGWRLPVHHLYSHDSREAAWQQNEYTRAGCCRPVCIESFTPQGERCAKLFPLPDGDSAKPLHFIYEAAFNAADGLVGYDGCMVDAVVYECASLLYTMFERYDAANAMLSQALAACGLQRVKQQ